MWSIFNEYIIMDIITIIALPSLFFYLAYRTINFFERRGENKYYDTQILQNPERSDLYNLLRYLSLHDEELATQHLRSYITKKVKKYYTQCTVKLVDI